MRPPRDDIAAPPFRPGARWSDGAERVMERLTAQGPVLVHFFDFAELNSVRSLEPVAAWHERYGPAGLTVLGVDTPRHPFGEDPDVILAAAERLGVPFPVLADDKRKAWADYGCHGWPSLFLWSRGGALRWYHFGEGEQAANEAAIREQLDGSGELPPSLEVPASVDPATRAPEILPGGSEGEPWRASAEMPALGLELEAGAAFATLGGAGTVEVELGGDPLPAVEVGHPGLYRLTPDAPERGARLVVRPSPGVLVYSLSFAPGD